MTERGYRGLGLGFRGFLGVWASIDCQKLLDVSARAFIGFNLAALTAD